MTDKLREKAEEIFKIYLFGGAIARNYSEIIDGIEAALRKLRDEVLEEAAQSNSKNHSLEQPSLYAETPNVTTYGAYEKPKK